MSILERLPLAHSWPLYEQGRHFDLGCVINSVITDAIDPTFVGQLGVQHAGCWECDLSDESLTWSGGVYDIFGIARGVTVTRDDCVPLYCEESRAKMEALRAHAIRHHRGFTLDAEIYPAIGERRWMRLICAPVVERGQVVRLHGLKLII